MDTEITSSQSMAEKSETLGKDTEATKKEVVGATKADSSGDATETLTTEQMNAQARKSHMEKLQKIWSTPCANLKKPDFFTKVDMSVGRISELIVGLQKAHQQGAAVRNVEKAVEHMGQDLMDLRLEFFTVHEYLKENFKIGIDDWKAKKRSIENRMRNLRDFGETDTAENGDTLIAYFRAKDENGNTVPRTEGTHEIILGNQELIPGLEEKYVGMKIGDSKSDVKVKFPENYFEKSFAGKEFNFDISIKDARKPIGTVEIQ